MAGTGGAKLAGTDSAFDSETSKEEIEEEGTRFDLNESRPLCFDSAPFASTRPIGASGRWATNGREFDSP